MTGMGDSKTAGFIKYKARQTKHGIAEAASQLQDCMLAWLDNLNRTFVDRARYNKKYVETDDLVAKRLSKMSPFSSS